MTYDLTVTMTGPTDTDAARIVSLFPQDPERKYDDATVAAFAGALLTHAQACGLRPSLIAAQIAKETGHFRFGGQVQAGQYNLAGLGATNGGAAGLSYADIYEGVAAVCAHHLTYIYGDAANWPPNLAGWYLPLDHRHDAVISAGKGGVVKELGDYTNGRWAYTSTIPEGSLANGYATGILELANTILTEAPPMANEPTQADIGYPVEVDYASLIGPDRAVADVQWFIVHDTEGGEVGSESVLKGSTASVHALIDTDGALEYMVPIEKTAWTAGNDEVSKLAIQVELVGFSRNPYPEEQYKSLAAFYRWCVAQGMTVPAVYIGRVDANGGPLPDAPGIIGHQDVPNPNVPGAWGGVSGHTDPGPNFDWQHFIDAINGVPAGGGGSPTYRRFAATGHGIDGGFKAYWESHGGLDIFGYPLTEEVQYGGRTAQFFQRAVFRLFPEFKGTAYEVQCDLLGVAAAKAAGYTGPGIF